MSKLDTAPFEIHDRVKWVNQHGLNQSIERTGVIMDAFWQKARNERLEGWRILIKKEYIDGDNTHLEKYFNKVERC